MEFFLNLASWFKTLPASGKISFFLVIVGAVTAGILLNSEIKHSGYQYLYTNLSMTDANAIAERLQSMSVEAKIQGDAVLVPGDRVLELRNTLASEGLPRGGGTGFEIFDEKNFGATEFQQRVNYIRAVQGELSRTITAIDGVEKARVHVVMPEKALFKKDSEAPSASVALTLYKGRRLSQEQVAGIVHLLVTSVEGLTASRVNVIDQNGEVLHRASGDEAGSMSSQAMDMRRNVEKGIEDRLTGMLEKIVGPGGVTVSVSAELNMARVEKTVESVDPESRVALQEQTITDQSSGSTGGSAGGAPGAAANIPGGAGAGEGGGSGTSESSKRTETSATYAVSKTIEKILEPVGDIRRLTVAVVVDGTYSEAEDGSMTYSPRTEEELQKIEEIAQRAVGYSEVRGDEVRVENLQFQRLDTVDGGQVDLVEATNSSRWTMFLLDNAASIGIVLIVGVIFLLLVRLINSYAPPVEVAYANIIGESAGQIAGQLPQQGNVNIVKRDDPSAKEKAEQVTQQLPELSLEKQNEQRLAEAQKQIEQEAPQTSEEKLRLQAAKMQTEQIIQGNPDDAVQVIRQWMSEE